MTAASRTTIFERLRRAGSSTHLPPTSGGALRERTAPSTEECLTRFVAEAQAVGVECFLEITADGVQARVRDLTAGLRVLTLDGESLPYGVASCIATDVDASADFAEQATAAVGVTGCDAAIAETGSLVVCSGPNRSRTVSLLPPFHVAILQSQQLCYSMAEFFDRHGAMVRQSTSSTFITGPSRTADIELTLTLGIHGPGRVAVIIGP